MPSRHSDDRPCSRSPPDVVRDVATELGMRSPRVVNTGVARDNLFSFEVIRTPNDEMKRTHLLRYLREVEGSGIVYTATVRAATELAAWLESCGIDVGVYHGKLPAQKRRETQDRFMTDQRRVMVATNAFGMGIDKPDVRFVVHWNVVDSLETYYQEAGRAGRDGVDARATLLFELEDKRVQQFFLGGKYPSREQSSRVYQALAAPADDLDDPAEAAVSARRLAEASGLPEKRVNVVVAQLAGAGWARRVRGGVVRARHAQSAEELDAILGAYERRHQDDKTRLDQMMRYAQSTDCRAQLLREYFSEPRGEPCRHCDNCRDDPAHTLAHSA